MGSQFVTDPFWGSFGASTLRDFEGAPGKALANTHAAEAIVDQRIKRQRENEAYQLTEKLLGTVEEAVPQAYTPPRAYTAADISDPARLDAPLRLTDRDAQTGADVPLGGFTDPREMAAAQARRRLAVAGTKATLFQHPEQWAPQLGQSENAAVGMPADPREQARVQFETTGRYPEPHAVSTNNYVAVDENGNTVKILGASPDGVHTADGRRLIDIAPPGSAISKAGELAIGGKPRTDMDDQASRQNALTKAAIGITQGLVPDAKRTLELEQILSVEYPAVAKVITSAIGDSTILHDFVEKQPPGPLKGLLEHIARTRYPVQAPPQKSVFDTGTDPLAATQPQQQAVAQPEVPPIYDPGRAPRQEILTRRPATEAETKAAQAIASTGYNRGIIEDLMGVQTDASGRPVLPPGAYVPSWMATVGRETLGTGAISDAILNKLDPKAREYFIAGRSWIEPVLRIASGAVTPPAEVTGYMNRFIPDANDTDQMKAQKINRMRIWERATRTAASAGDAINQILADPQTDPEARAMAEKLKVRAMNAGTLNLPTTALPVGGAARSTEPVTTTPAPTRARPGQSPPTAQSTNPRVDELLNH